ncbi:endolytic transglycosylase MltG [Actinocorallia longicatena]|uniref:Endolytic murein transglycosylase n=1 Tax=Actinocorallia longicatena TaxID=111803 RepID=A0ABP6Q8G8_9ACTN
MNNTDFWGDETRRESRADRSEQRKKQTRKKRGGGAAAVAALLFLVVVVGGGGYFGYTKLKNYMQPGDYVGEGTGAVTVEVKDGDYTSAIATTLQKADVVKSTKAFNEAAKDEPKSQGIQPGFYRMRLKMSAKSALALMLDPKSRAGVINVPEGRRAVEVFKLLSAQTKVPMNEFLKVQKNPKGLGLPGFAKGDLEGYLFPGQYNLPPKATAAQLLKPMVDRFKEQVGTLDIAAEGRKFDLTPFQVITMASLIEAEAGKPVDRRKISRVIYNRFKANMPLGFDTTILYILKKRTYSVTEAQTRTPSPYNTYLHRGLPVGAIGSPGLESIKAVLDPLPGKWLFFVTTDPTNRITEYAETYPQHQKLVDKFNAWARKHPGQ